MITVGVDLGIAKIAWSVWDDDILVQTGAYDASGCPTRGEQLHNVALTLVERMSVLEPDSIWIEETLLGNNVKYSIKLAQMMGAVLSGLHIGELEQNYRAYTVNVSQWKKEVLGKGNAKKEEIREYLYNANLAYPELCGGDQDRIDAACIGYYGYIISKRGEYRLGELRPVPEEPRRRSTRR